LGSWNLPLASVALLYLVSGAMWWLVDPEVPLDAEPSGASRTAD
jgi:hypothetical protein